MARDASPFHRKHQNTPDTEYNQICCWLDILVVLIVLFVIGLSATLSFEGDGYTTKWALRGLLLRRMASRGVRHLTVDAGTTVGAFIRAFPDAHSNLMKLFGTRRSHRDTVKSVAEELGVPTPWCPELWSMYTCFLNTSMGVCTKFLQQHVSSIDREVWFEIEFFCCRIGWPD